MADHGEIGDSMTFEEIAWEFVEVFDELDISEINEMLAKNVPLETLQFFTQYASEFASPGEAKPELHKRLPNLLLIGYILRVLEERLLEETH